MTASRFSHPNAASLTASLAATLVVGASVTGCVAARRDDAASVVTVSGQFSADGSCRVLVNDASLFVASEGPRTIYDAGPVADLAPAGYALHQLTCASADRDPTRQPDNAGARAVIVTLYAREGAPVHVGRYRIQEAMAADDTAGADARAGIAVFGAFSASPSTGEREAHGAGVRYLEGRAGTLTITGVGRSADGGRVTGTFNARASPAWSM